MAPGPPSLGLPSLSFIHLCIRATQVWSTFSATGQDEHLTRTDSLNLDSQPARQEGLSFCSITGAGRWEGTCQSLRGKQVVRGVQPGPQVPAQSARRCLSGAVVQGQMCSQGK